MKSAIHLAEKEQCTACGACKCACPTNSIKMQFDDMGCEYPYIDEGTCIGCGLCMKACPVDKDCFPDYALNNVYAAWNKDSADRELAASGGIATAVYRYALNNGIKSFGVEYTPKKSACYKEIKNEKDIEDCRNSKYVFSDITPTLPKIKQYLSEGEKVIVIALPCQAAAVISYLGGRAPNLIIIDIICHGVCPVTYLNQHISCVEEKTKKNAEKVYFRDPKFETGKFMFSVYDDKDLLYKCGVYKNDVYQIGYHKALTYRENCFSCKYAQDKRIGDITISDFSGLGRVAPFVHNRKSVSCVIVSTDKGNALIDELVNSDMIEIERRPSEEAFDYEKMLSFPSIPHNAIDIFKKEYRASQDFEKSARKALRKSIRKNMIKYYLHLDDIKCILAKICPKFLKDFVKKLVKK